LLMLAPVGVTPRACPQIHTDRDFRIGVDAVECPHLPAES
jgi:hypothetical protein